MDPAGEAAADADNGESAGLLHGMLRALQHATRPVMRLCDGLADGQPLRDGGTSLIIAGVGSQKRSPARFLPHRWPPAMREKQPGGPIIVRPASLRQHR